MIKDPNASRFLSLFFVIRHYLCVDIGDGAAQRISHFKLTSSQHAVWADRQVEIVLIRTQDFHNIVQRMVDAFFIALSTLVRQSVETGNGCGFTGSQSVACGLVDCSYAQADNQKTDCHHHWFRLN